MKTKIPTEQEEQICLMRWASYHPICKTQLFHIPNGGSRNKIEAFNLKRAGVKPGVSDLFLMVARMPYHGLWIELKRINSYACDVSINQNMFLSDANRAHYLGLVAKGWEHAREIILDYLDKPLWSYLDE